MKPKQRFFFLFATIAWTILIVSNIGVNVVTQNEMLSDMIEWNQVSNGDNDLIWPLHPYIWTISRGKGGGGV